MTPDLPLTWIATTKPNRDEGRYHLTATLEPSWGGKVVVAACGANPFAYSGCFPDSDKNTVGYRCQRCEAKAKKLRKPI